MTAQGKTEVAKTRYEYWGSGIKYHIDFQQFLHGATVDVLVTDNGKHFRMFDRISDILVATAWLACSQPRLSCLPRTVPLCERLTQRWQTANDV